MNKLIRSLRRRRGKRMRRPRKYKKRRIPWFIILLGIFVAVIVGGVAFYESQQANTNFPYPCLGSEPTTIHIHPYLRIEINGQNITVPAAIGIYKPVFSNGFAGGGPNSCFEPLHTHDSSGIIHVEWSSNKNFTLSDIFKIWNATDHLSHSVTINGVSHPIVFNATDILGFRADSTHRIVLLVDGQPSSEYQSLVLNTLDYCSAAPPYPQCSPTAVGDPVYGGITYPYGTGHTILIEYINTG